MNPALKKAYAIFLFLGCEECLYGSTHVVLMCYGIVEYLAQPIFRHFKFFYSLHALVMYGRRKVFGLQNIHHAACHLNDVSFYDILGY